MRITSKSNIDIEQHFKVIAGPGAGKTTFLINHIRNVLRESSRLNKCRKIACITYTNVGVDTIINKLNDSNDHVEVSTIHSFLFTHIVKPYLFTISKKYDLGYKFRIDDNALINLENDIPTRLIEKLKSIKNNIYNKIDFESELVKVIKKTNVSKFFKIIKENSLYLSQNFDSPFEHIISERYFRKTDLPGRYIKKNELKNMYWAIDNNQCVLKLKGRKMDFHNSLLKYKLNYWNNGIMHYDDVLAFAWEIINSNSNVLRVLRAKFPYFYIDEFQDTSPIQTEILNKIASEETVVGVIGDDAQSIYEFQGASVEDFKNFELPNIKKYKIEDNYRSTEQIIDVLCCIRTGFKQISPDKKQGVKPMILIGDSIKALEFVESKHGLENVNSLSFMNPTASAMRNRTTLSDEKITPIYNYFEFDSNANRIKVLISLIKSLEFSKVKLYADAIKEISRYFKGKDNFKGQKIALQVIKTFLKEYESIKEGSLFDFYERVFGLEYFKSGSYKISKISKLALIDSYKALPFSKIILSVRLNKDETQHRTIHKAKGDEFKNVIVIVKGKQGNKYKEEGDLSFLLNPTISKKESENERVYYVACSRAMNNLYINVPDISDSAKNKLKDIFEIKHV
ncbi:UvrD-helicase domain-containing protein [Polaribacter sp. 11A2H]|uniref:UvrD-helicase domain-containing protein n=1 Tax=Polaribacter sp. 11A2H TaxID=2687290 RepID=UPI001407CD01|nr:ATP-dependent helicase [Polaribacter sp. 11A2H]